MNVALRPRRIVVIVLIAFLAGALIAAVLVVTGAITFHRADSVPCNGLTSYEQVQTAVRDKADTIGRIKDSGSGVTVEPVKADCPSANGRLGYLRVTYANDGERDAIRKILGSGELGVFVVLDRR
ncbi:hypothetical protein [Bifidobacterium avesanii]|uniref:Uncharacterized protein n=1 Tax=Bifidobacterium avesanii TaxID=1798157 RepID=A0A7K3TE77_9BIFI|nr:hypothetical protein [Bifidobacterium avesanii]KAB8295409.1 hypothetical protein DSM100685_0019 [Bifidobacterium avesanii]NEG77415.1 hypothetical protein [Bifidobacterium avesanii]